MHKDIILFWNKTFVTIFSTQMFYLGAFLSKMAEFCFWHAI